MAYRFQDSEAVGDAVRRIAHEQIGKAIEEIEDEKLDRHETVHQVRKRCKKLRALLRLVRDPLGDVYQQENQTLRDAARKLSDTRDAAALLETWEGLAERYRPTVPQLASCEIGHVLAQKRDEAAGEAEEIDRKIGVFEGTLRQVQGRVDQWGVEIDAFDALAGGLSRTYRRGRKALDGAYDAPSVEAFHEWRKRVKYHRYHVRLLRRVWPKMMKAHRRSLHDLSDYLGEHHDLDHLESVLRAEPERYGDASQLHVVLGIIARRRVELETRARPLGERLYTEKPKTIARRLGEYWSTWRRYADLKPQLARAGDVQNA